MSQRSLLLATKQFLQTKLTWNGQQLEDSQINIGVDGRPAPFAGDLFISIHPGSFRNRSSEHIEAIHSLYITINRRITTGGFDRFGPEFLAAEDCDSVNELAQQIIEIMHLNYELMQLANSIINNPSINTWIEPLRFDNCPPPRIVSGDWFHADANNREEGIIQTISFRDAVRVQWGSYTDVVDINQRLME